MTQTHVETQSRSKIINALMTLNHSKDGNEILKLSEPLLRNPKNLDEKVLRKRTQALIHMRRYQECLQTLALLKKLSRDDLYYQGFALFQLRDQLAALDAWAPLYDEASDGLKSQISILTKVALDHYETLSEKGKDTKIEGLFRLAKRLYPEHPTLVSLSNRQIEALWNSGDFELILKLIGPPKKEWNLPSFLNYVKAFYHCRDAAKCDALSFCSQYLTAGASYALMRRSLADASTLFLALSEKIFDWLAKHPQKAKIEKIVTTERDILKRLLARWDSPTCDTVFSPSHFDRVPEDAPIRQNFLTSLKAHGNHWLDIMPLYDKQGYSWHLFQCEYWETAVLEKDRRSPSPSFPFWARPDVDLHMSLLYLKEDDPRAVGCLENYLSKNRAVSAQVYELFEGSFSLERHLNSSGGHNLWLRVVGLLPFKGLTGKLASQMGFCSLLAFPAYVRENGSETDILKAFLKKLQPLVKSQALGIKVEGSLERLKKIETLAKARRQKYVSQWQKLVASESEVWDWFLTIAYCFAWIDLEFKQQKVLVSLASQFFSLSLVRNTIPTHVWDKELFDCLCDDSFFEIVSHFRALRSWSSLREKTQEELPLYIEDQNDIRSFFNSLGFTS